MDDVARARAATREAVADITPPRLRELIDARLEDATMTPGMLVGASARAAGSGEAVDAEELDRRTAGVQLIYEGLALTRSLARSPPWAEESTVAADLDVLIADVLVARGFYLLARTEAAPKAVETVRAVGRDETVNETRDGEPAPTLEIDVFEMAIVAGVSAAGGDPPTEARAFASDLADARRTNGSDPLDESTIDALDDLVGDGAAADGVAAQSRPTDT